MPKMTLQISPEMDAIIEQLAQERGVPKSQVIRRAVLLLNYLDSDEKEVTVTDVPTGKTSTVVFESQIGGAGAI